AILLYHVVLLLVFVCLFFFSSRRRHTRCYRDWSSDVCSSDLSVMRPSTTPSMASQAATAAAVIIGSLLGGTMLAGLSRPSRSSRSEERRVGKECRSRRAPGH